MSNLTIGDGKVVHLAYVLKNADGEELDSANSSDPFAYLHGASQIVPGLESELAGLKKGEKKKVTVPPSEGYGEVDSDLVLKVKRTQFPADVELEEGMQFETHGPDGSPMVFTVEKIEDDTVSVNGNHPLAGVTLHFDVEVLEVREATAEELDHGHAHGGDGHHHH